MRGLERDPYPRRMRRCIAASCAAAFAVALASGGSLGASVTHGYTKAEKSFIKKVVPDELADACVGATRAMADSLSNRYPKHEADARKITVGVLCFPGGPEAPSDAIDDVLYTKFKSSVAMREIYGAIIRSDDLAPDTAAPSAGTCPTESPFGTEDGRVGCVPSKGKVTARIVWTDEKAKILVEAYEPKDPDGSRLFAFFTRYAPSP